MMTYVELVDVMLVQTTTLTMVHTYRSLTFVHVLLIAL